MTSDNKSTSADEGRVVSFRGGRPVARPPAEPPVADLDRILPDWGKARRARKTIAIA